MTDRRSGSGALRGVAGAGVTLVVCAAIQGAILGLPAAASAALAALLLGIPALPAAAVVGWVDRRRPAASGAALALTALAFGSAAVSLHDLFGNLSLRPTSLLGLGLGAVLAGGTFALLRLAFGAVARRSSETVRRKGSRSAAVAAVVLLAVGFTPPGAPPHESAPPEAETPNVLLLTVDTLRADHLSAYGYDLHRTPAFDRIADAGIRFESAYTTAPWTLAGLTSLMTGHYPSALGIHARTREIPSSVTTLAEWLAEAGYDTHAVVTNVYTERGFRLNRGFRGYVHLHDLGVFDGVLFDHPLYRLAQRVKLKFSDDHADRVVDEGLDWLASRRDPDRPFFLWMHFMDPHQPYGGAHVSADLPCGGAEVDRFKESFNHVRFVRNGTLHLTPAERAHMVHLYDANIRFLDRELGRLLDALERQGADPNTLLVATSDHGEEFWEHGDFTHGHSVHEEVTRVPLLVRWPGRVEPGTVVAEPVSLAWVARTLASAAGVTPETAEDALVPLGPSRPPDRYVLSENVHYGRERKALRGRARSLLLDPETGAFDVYDRRHDRAEQRPLAGAGSSPLLAALRARMEENASLQVELAMDGSASRSLSPEQRERLRALGYLD